MVSLSKKLALGFSVCIIITLLLAVFAAYQIQRLQTYSVSSLEQMRKASVAVQAGAIGSSLFQAVSTATIVRNIDESEAEWFERKSDAISLLDALQKAAIDSTTQGVVDDLKRDLDSFIQTFEPQLLVKIKATALITPEIQKDTTTLANLARNINTLGFRLRNLMQEAATRSG